MLAGDTSAQGKKQQPRKKTNRKVILALPPRIFIQVRGAHSIRFHFAFRASCSFGDGKLTTNWTDTALPAEQSGQAERYWRYGGGWAAATTYIQIRQSIRMGRPAMTQKTTTATVMAIELWQYNVSKANNKLITELENQWLSSGTWN